MNITEAQAVSTLLVALQGGEGLDGGKVFDAAWFCKDRIHKVLYASPDVKPEVVDNNLTLLQQGGWKA